jgi:hypothetical protein
VARASTAKAALTVAALGTTGYARLLGKKLERAGDVPVEGGTTPNPTTRFKSWQAHRTGPDQRKRWSSLRSEQRCSTGFFR